MMHFGERFTDEEVEEMIAEADSNRDGKIDYTEFSQMILKEIDTDPRTKAHLQPRFAASFSIIKKWNFKALNMFSSTPRHLTTTFLSNGGMGSSSSTPARRRKIPE